MKNKEIIKRLKDSLDYEFNLSFSDRKELLSYIEQLENNRDKAIEYLNTYAGYDNNFCLDYHEINPLIDILKGDSDDTR